MIKKAKYRNIPCLYNNVNDELIGTNWFYNILLDIIIWIDINIFQIEEFPLWIEVDDLEKGK
jgi:hypothetical protein